MKTSRRRFLQTCGTLAAATVCQTGVGAPNPAARRTYHFSTSCRALDAHPELLDAATRAGVTHLWLAGSWCDHWDGAPKDIQRWRQRIAQKGLATDVINIPLGHPDCPAWKPAVRPDGSTYTGTSLHAPATEQNCALLRELQAIGIKELFLDDDFRLASMPGVIGGCFCPEHKQAFLKRCGFQETHWNELLDATKNRRLTPTLRAWVEYQCDELTACFRAQQKAVPEVQLAIMVMYLGAEKAGIRLADYRDLPMRVGEFKFSDDMFNPVKGKTDELFSSLFHRRFVKPEQAYSETTAFPDGRLSLKNKIAKLAVSTLSDVRNTMFMCDFPTEHWASLAPAMKHHAQIHPVIAGHVPRGPLKHFWGEASRYVSDDNPYSLCLALGIPFEVTAEPAGDGFTFLSDAGAQTADRLPSAGTTFLGRPQPGLSRRVRPMAESLPELLAWKREVLPQLGAIPYVEGDVPVVCAWYPTARAVLVWNLSENPQDFRLRHGNTQRTIRVAGLDLVLVEGLGTGD